MNGEKNIPDLPGILHRAAVWLLSAAVSVVGIIVWDNHTSVSKHGSLFNSVWTQGFHDRLISDLEYPSVHETYRRVYVDEDVRFKETVRKFMSAGGRFSAEQGDKHAQRIRGLEQRVAVQERRIEDLFRRLERMQ